MWSHSLCLKITILVTLFRQNLALTVTKPDSGTVWHLHQSNVVEWKSVETDPESIAIKLVNNNAETYPSGYSQELKDGINTADNKFSLDTLPEIKAGKGYQVNIMSSSGTILAQSAQFAINGTAEKTPDQTHLNSPVTAAPTLPASAPSATASASDATIGRSIPGFLAILTCLVFAGLSLL